MNVTSEEENGLPEESSEARGYEKKKKGKAKN